jgi:predicted metal-binding membrane protein
VNAERSRAIASIIFLLSALLTWWSSHSMGGGIMRMPGGWTMSMMWMAMPGDSMWSTAIMFLAMWQSMMIAMMLPSAWPMLELYRRVAISTEEKLPGLLTAFVGTGYFGAWLGFGLVAFAVGFTWSGAAMRSASFSSLAPLAAGAGLILAGAFQLSPWKNACLTRCRSPLLILGESWRRGPWAALRIGWKHGLFCVGCCWALMLIQIILGATNMGVMILVAVVIGFEKLWKQGPLLARAAGIASMVLGAYLVAAATVHSVQH